MDRQLVILNPRAGRMQAGRRLGEILPLLEGDGVTAELLETGAPGKRAAPWRPTRGQYRRVVCIGGDGTLNEVISGMLDAGVDVPIGYVAAGSTNDFAASHGIAPGHSFRPRTTLPAACPRPSTSAPSTAAALPIRPLSALSHAHHTPPRRR